MRVLLAHGHTLYAKVTIPLALRLLADGHEVIVHRRRDRLRGFSGDYVRSRPTHVQVVDRASLRFTARLIGYRDEWAAAEDRAEVRRVGRRERFDAVVGTTKDLDPLRAIAARDGVPVFALGYQHMPYVVTVGGGGPPRGDSLFLRHHPFTDAHRFLEIIGDDAAVPNAFTFLDRVMERRPAEPPERDRVLIFHPGGWRNVVTAPGEGARVSREKQLAFFERACRPLLEAGLTPVVKVHPLRARHHDLEEVAAVVERIGGDAIRVLGPEDWFWEDAFRSAFVVNYGSSSNYELWSAGIRTALVCNFEGAARSGKFSLFESLFIDTHEDYEAFVREERWRGLELDPLAAEVAAAYERLCDGRAAERAAEVVTARA